MGTLDGKVALVTGASRGIGRAIAVRLAAEGADVALTYLSSPGKAAEVVGEIEAAGRRAFAIEADSANAADVARAVDTAAETLGGLDILVNNAGVITYGSVGELRAEDVDRMLAVNLRAVIAATDAAARHIRNGGRVISIGSNLAERVTRPGLSVYAATKSALLAFTRGIARDLGPRQITAVVVHPGPTDTDMNPAAGPRAAQQITLSAVGHYGEVADIAATVVHLAGDGGRHISGTAVTVDGGQNA